MESEMADGASSHDKENCVAGDHKERTTANDSFYRIPTTAELRQLREMSSLQAGSLLRLQAEELVNSITPPEYKTSKSTLRFEEEWVPMLSEILTAMRSERLEPKDLLPGFDIGVKNVQEGLNFSPPSEIEIVGSHSLHCNIKPSGSARREVDIAVTMPASCISPRDFVGYRYLAKRALYASHLAKNLLNQTDFVRNVSVTHMRHDPCKPCVLLEPILSSRMAARTCDDGDNRATMKMNKDKRNNKKRKTESSNPRFSALYAVKLLVCLPEDEEGGLDSKKLAPWRSNVRRITTDSSNETKTDNADGSSSRIVSSSPPPTFLYNSCILEDIAMRRESLALQEGIGKYESAKGCVLLGKVWLAQRGILSTCDGLCGHSWSMIVLHLLHTKAINPSLGPMAMFRVVLRWITTYKENYNKSGLTNLDSALATVQTGTKQLYHSQQDYEHFAATFPVVLMDEYYGLNVLWRISIEGWAEVVNEAQRSLAMLENSPTTCFNSLFLNVAGPLLRYDTFIKIAPPSNWSGSDNGYDDSNGAVERSITTCKLSSTLKDQLLDKGGGGKMRVLATRISTLLKSALTDRVEMIRPLVPTPTAASGGGSKWRGECKHWDVMCKPPGKGLGVRTSSECEVVMFGLRLFSDNENATRLVDRGPPASSSSSDVHQNGEDSNKNENNSAAGIFRAFWGEKSELRRFKDGGIIEAVIWKDIPSHSIIENACRYILIRHEPGVIMASSALGNRERVTYSGGNDVCEQFEATAAAVAASTGSRSSGGDSNKHLTQNAIKTCDEVIKCLKGLANIVLRIRSASTVSSMLRYTSLFPPVPHPAAGGVSSGSKSTTSQVNPISIILTLESSAQWPSDPEAIKAVQKALLVRIHDSLRGVSSTSTSDIVNGMKKGYHRHHAMHHHEFPHPISHVSPFLVLLPGENDQDENCYYYALEIFAMGFVFHVSLSSGGNTAIDAAVNAANDGTSTTTLLASASPHNMQQHLKLLSPQKRCILHHTAIHSLATRFVSYGPAVILAHRWVASRYLSNHFSKECLELLVAHAYTAGDTHDSALPIPGSALSGLLRFLLLLSGRDWYVEPLVVDLGESMGHEGRRAATDSFSKLVGGERKAVLHIITPYDYYTSAWTTCKPEASVLALAAKAAAASAGQLLRYISNEGGLTDGKKNDEMMTFAHIFQSQPPQFNTSFSVNSNLCWDIKGRGGAFKSLQRRLRGCPAMRLPAHRNLTVSRGMGLTGVHKRLLVGFDPVKKLVNEIEKMFDWVTVIFWNDCRRNEIGIVWRPKAFEPADFKPLHCFSTEPCKTGQVKLNKQQILREIQWLGGDMLD